MFLYVLIVLFTLWVLFRQKISTLPRDLHLVYHAGRTMIHQKWLEMNDMTCVDVFKTQVKERPYKIAFRHLEDKSWTYKKLDEESNKMARYLDSLGFSKGDCVALLMEGCPEYVAVWLSVAKLAGVTALINTNQTKDVLQRSIQICNAKYLVYGTNLTNSLSPIVSNLDVKLLHIGSGDGLEKSTDLKKVVEKVSSSDIMTRSSYRDPLLYIYTSGTTGLPKAAIMTNARYMMMSLAARTILGMKDNDVVYTPLPLYHSAGGILGVGQSILGGSTVVIRTKFSATNFFKDCIKYKCTVAQYIGEICRYILATPESSTDREHSVRLMYGNGLRKQVWEDFVKRFGVKQIGEFYGATEGNSSAINAWNKPGAVGYIPWFVRTIHPVVLIRVDDETDEPLKDKNGFCILCETNEPGLLIGKILNSRATSHFNGYVDKEATQKKILHDVFEKGDSYFNSGDILLTDEEGYLYFRDRKGDTFRWKGENVATTEVESVISKIVGDADTTVYGVEIPGSEGRAGMAAIVDPSRTINFALLYSGIEENLSSYARPVFIRIVDKLQYTGTFKIQKSQMQKEGFDVTKISDPIYFLDSKSKKYVPLEQNLYQDIINNVIKF